MSLLPISDLGRSKLALAAAVTGASGSRSSNRGGGGGGGRGDQPQGMLARSMKPSAAYFYHAQMLLMHKVIQSLLQDQQ